MAPLLAVFPSSAHLWHGKMAEDAFVRFWETLTAHFIQRGMYVSCNVSFSELPWGVKKPLPTNLVLYSTAKSGPIPVDGKCFAIPQEWARSKGPNTY